MSDSVTQKAYAKLNLSLNVLEKRGRYHDLVALNQTIDLYDEVTLSAREDSNILSDFEGDNALVVLRKLQEVFSFKGVEISVKKHIPIGGGLGGSSASAAAAALACAKLFSLPLTEVEEIAAPLFGDIAFQMQKGTAIVRGKGDLVETLAPLPPYYALLCFPQKGVSTEAAFSIHRQFERQSVDPYELYSYLASGKNENRISANDLFLPAITLNEEIFSLFQKLKDDRSLLRGMSGSGSTLFSIYQQRREAEEKAVDMPCRTLITRFSQGI